ncbi:MAG TPA: hypothetical protein VMU16_00785 [Candidatus Binataceae bacterium]|nr:hypothetical protein [Candidatus Binataceae bacterium]
MLGMIFIGLVSGWLAGKMINGHGYGMFADIILGLFGGVIGGWFFGPAGVHAHHFIGAVAISTLGATGLVMATRVLRGEF